MVPVFQGQLRIEHRHPPGVTLELIGSYRPPDGTAGNVIDAIAMHRIADSTAERFLEEIAERMTTAAFATT